MLEVLAVLLVLMPVLLVLVLLVLLLLVLCLGCPGSRLRAIAAVAIIVRHVLQGGHRLPRCDRGANCRKRELVQLSQQAAAAQVRMLGSVAD